MRGSSPKVAVSSIVGVALALLVQAGPQSPLVATAASPALVTDPASLVNPLIMTSAGGNDFPGADMPQGMIQLSPDTDNRSAGGNYDAGAGNLLGFALTHVAGPGCGAMGDGPILPYVGAAPATVNALTEPINHGAEAASNAGYYTVTSGSSTSLVKTELTTTQRTGMMRITYPASTQAALLIKLRDSQNQNNTDPGSARIVSTSEVAGSITSGHFCGAQDTYVLHFDMVFDHSFTSSKIIGPSSPGPDGVYLAFNTSSAPVLVAKIGISFVSDANAALNLQTESPSFDFDGTHTAAHAAWNAVLGKIQIAGGTHDQQVTFYSSLYHALLHPNVVSDVNGQYLGYDQRVHTIVAGQNAHYEQFSGWDIQHGQAAIDGLVAPQEASDMAQSLVQAYEQIQVIPQWGFMNSVNGVMLGDSADYEVAHYYAFGARSFDTASALKDLVKQATTDNQIRGSTTTENQLGYIPDDPSSLIEFDQQDFALAKLAQAMGDMTDANFLAKRSANWKNIFDPSSKLLGRRQQNGSFMSITPCDQGYVEGTAAQYRFQVPYNQAGEAAAIGGNSATNAILDGYFKSFDGSVCSQSFEENEFDLGQPWFYDFTQLPSHTQETVHRELATIYGNSPSAFQNNDDLGTMSSQYVWGALGMYPVTPGTADVALDSPIFTQAVIHLSDGNNLVVNAPQASAANFYVQSLAVNGVATTHDWLPASMFFTGGTVDFTLGPAPSSWGTGSGDAPPSYDGTVGAPPPVVPPPTPGPPGAPTNVQATGGNAQANVTWTGPTSTGGSPIRDYAVYGYSPTGTAQMSVSANPGSFTATGLTNESYYTFTVIAYNGQWGSWSGWSPWALVTAVTPPVPPSGITDLSAYYNNVGISDDGSPASASLDAGGYSFSEQALTAAGLAPSSKASFGGQSFNWPNVPAGQDDNVLAQGQALALRSPASATVISFLGTGTNGDGSSAATIHFADGSSQTFTLTMGDWAGSGAAGDQTMVTMPYRNSLIGKDLTPVSVFYVTVRLSSTSTVTGVTLPSNGVGALHIFAIAFG